MSRHGRAIELLDGWRDHPRECTAEHGYTTDGYDGWCGGDAEDVLAILEQIDWQFHGREVDRLRNLIVMLGGQEWLDRLDDPATALETRHRLSTQRSGAAR